MGTPGSAQAFSSSSAASAHWRRASGTTQSGPQYRSNMARQKFSFTMPTGTSACS
jgi:hypothetical protein